MMTTVHGHDVHRPVRAEAPAGAPSSAWVQRVADWIEQSSAGEARDIARDVAAVADRIDAQARPSDAVVSTAWLLRLADWVERDPRPQAADIARQLRDWASISRVIRLPH